MASRSEIMPISDANAHVEAMRPTLSRAMLIDPSWQPTVAVNKPQGETLLLPERAVQFGTGAFLRGFIEYFLDEANRQQLFNGRVVLVGSTESGRDRAFAAQDGLFTLQCVGAREEDAELRIVASVSRAISAKTAWQDVLSVARQPEISLVFSNTTEAGFALDEADIELSNAPQSFPAKLTAFLYERARAFNFDCSRGVVVLPCELLDNNGDALKSLVRTLATRWQLPFAFTEWLDDCVPFCNTLVDRIVPGAPPEPERARLVAALGYADDLLTVAEPYRLFVIEADTATRARLPFVDADRGIIVADNIRAYRERKVRLLNGTHTAMAAVGLLAGVATVDETMRDSGLALFARELLLGAIAPKVTAPDARAFGEDVLMRFANPHVYHRLADIANQGTLKLRVRLLPIVQRYTLASQPIPRSLIVAIAAQFVLMHPQSAHAMVARGEALPTDDLGAHVRRHWDIAPQAFDGVARILADSTIWKEDLSRVPGLAAQVGAVAAVMLTEGVRAALQGEIPEAQEVSV
ncbi:MAG: tagaturonate reductase [Gemmatimonadaceae bacterium]